MKLKCSKAAASMLLFSLTPPAVEPPGGHIGLKAMHRAASRLLKVFDGKEPSVEHVMPDGQVATGWTFFDPDPKAAEAPWDEVEVEVELEQSWYDALAFVWGKTPKLKFLNNDRKRSVCVAVQDALDAAKAAMEQEK